MLCACGENRETIFQNVIHGDRSGLQLSDVYSSTASYVGEIQAELIQIDPRYHHYDCKNNRLLLTALAGLKNTLDAILKRYGPQRIGVVLGTSTSG